MGALIDKGLVDFERYKGIGVEWYFLPPSAYRLADKLKQEGVIGHAANT